MVRFIICFIVGTILYFTLPYALYGEGTTDGDALLVFLCIASVLLAVILYFIDNDGGGVIAFIRTIVLVFSYHAVFWLYIQINYNYDYHYEELPGMLIEAFGIAIIYVAVILIAGITLRKFNLFWVIEHMEQVNQEKHQTELRKEISWLHASAEKILKEMRRYLSRLDGGFTQTPSDSRDLLYLLSSISIHEDLLKLGQQNVTHTKNVTLDNIHRLSSGINELRAVTNKVKLYENINTIKEQIIEFERTIRHLDECVKKQDSTLLDVFKQEDHRVLYVDQVNYEYRNLVNQFRKLNQNDSKVRKSH